MKSTLKKYFSFLIGGGGKKPLLRKHNQKNIIKKKEFKGKSKNKQQTNSKSVKSKKDKYGW